MMLHGIVELVKSCIVTGLNLFKEDPAGGFILIAVIVVMNIICKILEYIIKTVC